MTEPTKEYWQAKAQLCEKVAQEQLMNLDTLGAMRNLERMVYALSRVDGFKREGEIICTFCNDNSKSCRACDEGYEGE